MTRILPQSVISFLRPRPPAPRADASSMAPAGAPLKQPDTKKIPLKFAYVSVPHDQTVASNPNAPLASDKSRKARQEKPTPLDAKRFSIDPHSEGTSIDRVKPDPSRPQGREDVEAQSRPRHGAPSAGKGGPEKGLPAKNNPPTARATPQPDGLRPPGEMARAAPAEPGDPGREGETPGDPGVPDGSDANGQDSRQS